MKNKKRVVIVGAGFGGLNAAKALGKHSEIDVTIIDSKNHHLFQPLLYQVATAELSPADIATPVRSVLKKYKNCRVVLASVVAIDAAKNQITSAAGEVFEYDFLVLACGAGHSYFGHDEWEEFAPGLKTLEQATEIRRRILSAFERAEATTDKELQKELQTFLIVGGGPAGVELAGAIAEINRYMLDKEFRNIRAKDTRVILVEAGPRILTAFPESLSSQAQRDLNALGVEVLTSARVSHIDSAGVKLGDVPLRAKTVIWSAGVKPSPLAKLLNTPLDAAGRVIVTPNLNLPSQANIFVIGDMARNEVKGQPLPGVAPVAIQQGKYVARAISHASYSKPFRYLDKGIMATIGTRKAILKVRSLEMHGLLAWFAWVFVHLFYLIGFKNRLFVMIDWAWEYFTFRRGARLILNKDWQASDPAPPSEKPASAEASIQKKI